MQVYTSCSYVCKLLSSDVVVHVTIRRIYIYIYIYFVRRCVWAPAIGWRWLCTAIPTLVTRTSTEDAATYLVAMSAKLTSSSACGERTTQYLTTLARVELTAPAMRPLRLRPSRSHRVRTSPQTRGCPTRLYSLAIYGPWVVCTYIEDGAMS